MVIPSYPLVERNWSLNLSQPRGVCATLRKNYRIYIEYTPLLEELGKRIIIFE